MKEKLQSLKKSAMHLASSLTDEKNKLSAQEVPWVKHVALLTGILAAFSGFLTIRTTGLTNDAIYQSNQAILAQAQASDAWTEYQADSINARIIETQLVPSSPLSAEDKDALSKTDEEIRARQPQSKQTALDQTKMRDDRFQAGLTRLGEKDTLDYASLAAQLGIALASVAAMSRQRTAFHISVAVGFGALAIAAFAFIQHGVF